ncbi:MAG: outer membrane beta-barrel protein [Hyphomicrobiaceae bacterium]|nr:outer membrane beta-barrel protein [Hyphomicrobiaceae bacterium]
MMLRWAAVYTATILLFIFSGSTDAGAVVVSTDVVSEGEPVPGAEITFETAAGEPVDLFTTETSEETPGDQASSEPSQTPVSAGETPESAAEPGTSGAPPAIAQPKEEQTEQAAVPATGGAASASTASETGGQDETEKRTAVTVVTTDAQGRAAFQIDDRYRGQALVMVIKKDGRVIERRNVVVSTTSMDLSVHVPRAVLTGVPAGQSQASSYPGTDYGTATATGETAVVETPTSSHEPADAPGPASTGQSNGDWASEWTGPYWGLSAGLGGGRSSGWFDHAGFEFSSSPKTNVSGVADIYVGANAQVAPRIVLGVQVEGSLGQLNFDSEDENVAASSVRGQDVNQLELEWMISVLGRAGWLVTPDTLLYGLLGWTYGHFDVEEFVSQASFEPLRDFGSNGITAGAGIEKKLSPLWTLRAEYRYTHFADESFTLRPDPALGWPIPPLHGSFENDLHVGRIGATRYFSLPN